MQQQRTPIAAGSGTTELQGGQQQPADGFSVGDLGETDPQKLVNDTILQHKTAADIQNAYTLGQINKETATGAIAQLQKTYQSASPDEQKAMDQAETQAEKQQAPRPADKDQQSPAAQTFSSLLAAGIPGVVFNKLPIQDVQNYLDDQHKQGALSDAQYANSTDLVNRAKGMLQTDPRFWGGVGLGATKESINQVTQAEQDVANLLDQAAPDFLKLRPQQAATEVVKAKDNFLNDVKNFLFTSPIPEPAVPPLLKQNPAQTSASLDKAYQNHQDELAKFTVTPQQQDQVDQQMRQQGLIPNTPEFQAAHGMAPKPGAETGLTPLVQQAGITALSMIPMPWDPVIDAAAAKFFQAAAVPFAKSGAASTSIGKFFLRKGYEGGKAALKGSIYGVGESIARDPAGAAAFLTQPENLVKGVGALAATLGIPTAGGALVSAPFLGYGLGARIVASIFRSASPEVRLALEEASGRALSTEIPYRAYQNPLVQVLGRTLNSYTTSAGRGIPFAAAADLPQGDINKFLSDVNQFGYYGAIFHAPQNIKNALQGGIFDSIFAGRGEDPDLRQAPPILKYGDSYYDPVQGKNINLDAYVEKGVKSVDPSRQATFTHAQQMIKPYADAYMLPEGMYNHVAQANGSSIGSSGFVMRDPTTGRLKAFFNANHFDTAALHEMIGHVAYRSMGAQNQAGFQHLISQVGDMDSLANTYANKANPGLNYKGGMSGLPDEAEVDPSNPRYDQQKAQFAQSIGNLTKERAYEEAAAEHMQALYSGQRADQWTQKPSLLRQFAYYVGAGAEGIGIGTTTPDVNGPLGVSKSVAAAKALDLYLRDFFAGNIPPTGATKNYFGGPGTGTPWAPGGAGGGGGPMVPTTPGGGGGGFATAKPAQVIAVRNVGQQGTQPLPGPQPQLPGPPAAPAAPAQPIYTLGAGETAAEKPAAPEAPTTPAAAQPQADPTVVAGLMKRGFTREQAEDFAARSTVSPVHGAPRAQLVSPPAAQPTQPTGPAPAVDVTGEAAKGTMAGEGPGTHGQPDTHAQVRQLIKSGTSPGEAQQIVEGGHDPQTTRVMRATWFGRNPDGSVDTTDEGRMSYYNAHHGAWGADLLDKNLTGVAVSRSFLEANGIDPRKSPSSQGYKMRVTAPNGNSEVVDIVDIGPDNKIDMTYGLGKKLGLSDNSQLSAQLLDKEGKTVTLRDKGTGTAFMPGGGGGGGGAGAVTFTPTPGFMPSGGGQAPKAAQQPSAQAQPSAQQAEPPAAPAPVADTLPENIYPATTGGYNYAYSPSEAEGGGAGGGIPAAPGIAFMPSGGGARRRQAGGIPLEEEPGAQPSTMGVPNPGEASLLPLLARSKQTAATLSSALQTHAQSLSPDDTRVKKQADNFFKGEHFQLGDALHAHVLSNVPEHEHPVLQAAQNAIANHQLMHVTYASAPRTGLGEAAPTTRTRQIEYGISTPQARMLKQTKATLAGHTFVPTAVGMKLAGKQGEPHESYVQGVSTNAIANNHHHLNQALLEAGQPTPYPELNNKFFNDLEGYVSNLNAGYTGTGEGHQAETEEYPVTVDPTHVPYRLKRHEADYINALINNQAARAKSATGLRELARKGGTLISEEGETNPIRHAIDTRKAAIREALAQAHPENPLLQKQAEKRWSQDILEPTIRTFKAGLVHAIHPRPEAMPEAIRPGEEFKEISEGLQRHSPHGRPDVPVSVAFMPMAGKKAKDYHRAWAEGRTFETPLPGGGERFEISDRNMKLKPAPEGSPYSTALEHHYHQTWGEPMPLHQAIDHPELFENYPQLRKTKISMNPDQRADGLYEHPYSTDEGKERGNEIHLKDPQDRESLAHEMQHAVQYIEGHPPGASPEQTYIDIHNEPGVRDEVQKAAKEQYPNMSRKEFLAKQAAEGWGNLPKQVQNIQYNDYLDTQRIYRRNFTEKRMKQMAYAMYRRSPGEMEAKVAGERASRPEPPEGFMRPEEQLQFEKGWTGRNYPLPPELPPEHGLAFMPAGSKKSPEQIAAEKEDLRQAAIDRENITPEEKAELDRIQKIAQQWVKDNPELPDISAHHHLEDREQFPGSVKTKEDIGNYFDRRNKKLDFSKPEHQEIAANALMHDTMRALAKNSSAFGWYDRTVDKSLNKVGEIAPKILSDPEHALAFKLATAITSQGQDVFPNFESGYLGYRHWVKTGKLPEDAKVFGGGTKAPAMIANFKKINELWNTHGYEGLKKILETPMSMRELADNYGIKLGGESPEHEMEGAALLGPKIGSFFNNLNKRFHTITFDLWNSRTMNRLAGSMMKFSPNSLLKDKSAEKPSQLSRLESLLDSGRLEGADEDEMDKMREEAAALRELGEKPSRAKVLKAAPTIIDWADREHNRYAKGTGGRSYPKELKTDSSSLAKNLDLNFTDLADAPRGPRQRKQWRDIYGSVQNKMADAGIDMTHANNQAALWYLEQALFRKGGSRNRASFDYLDAAHRLVRKVKSGELPGIEEPLAAAA